MEVIYMLAEAQLNYAAAAYAHANSHGNDSFAFA